MEAAERVPQEAEGADSTPQEPMHDVQPQQGLEGALPGECNAGRCP